MRHVATKTAIASALMGLGASIASMIDHVGAQPTFCAEAGCATVRHSAWSQPLGIPLPVIGIAYFAGLLVLAIVAAPRLRRSLAVAGGLGGVGLIAIQAFWIHAWCKLCLVSDVTAIVHAVAVLRGAATIRATLVRGAGAVVAVGAVALALMLGTVPGSAPTSAPAQHEAIPAAIARLQVPGKLTLVEFVDFECPFCRQLAPKVDAAVARASQPVAIVRKMVPLSIHERALAAALAWCCADAQGKGDAMAAALFEMQVEELTAEGCERAAVRVGCDLQRYRASLADPMTRERIARDVADAKSAGVKGLPTLFVAGQLVEGGDHSEDELVALLESAGRRHGL